MEKDDVESESPEMKDMAVVFFFSSRRRHTRLQGDWSSDVCSSDLISVIRPMGMMTEMYFSQYSPRNDCRKSPIHGSGGRGSEEGRVGEEGRIRGAPDHLKKKK